MGQPKENQELLIAIARAVHEAERAYSLSIGETQPPWEELPSETKATVREGVRAVLNMEVCCPSECHARWAKRMIVDGWDYGPEKNPAEKTHPGIVPWRELPVEQAEKDVLFFRIVSQFDRYWRESLK